MRTHELASILRSLSDALGHMPDTEITSLPEILKSSAIYEDQETTALPQVVEGSPSSKSNAAIDDIHQTLTTLNKKQVVALIDEAGIPVEIRSKDSAKAAARKVKVYLTYQPNATRKVRSILRRKHSVAVSEPLSKALGILLGDNDEVSATRS